MENLRKYCDGILVLDTETSGLDWKNEEIIEFAAVRLEWAGTDWAPVAETDEFVRRAGDRKLDPKITELTGITDEMLLTRGISKEALCGRLKDLFLPRTLITAYNAQFDLLFLFSLLQKYGDLSLLKDQPKLDLLTVYRDRRPYPQKLCNAIEAYHLQDRVQNTHRAIDDVKATVEVMRAMSAECSDLDRYIDLFGYIAKHGLHGPKISSVCYKPQYFENWKKLYER